MWAEFVHIVSGILNPDLGVKPVIPALNPAPLSDSLR